MVVLLIYLCFLLLERDKKLPGLFSQSMVVITCRGTLSHDDTSAQSNIKYINVLLILCSKEEKETETANSQDGRGAGGEQKKSLK